MRDALLLGGFLGLLLATGVREWTAKAWDRLVCWYHYVHGGPRPSLSAWVDACDSSRAASYARRHRGEA